MLAQLETHPEHWPYHGRLVVEDCETVHLHVNNFRWEFHREQFLHLADVLHYAAATLRQIMAEEQKAKVATDG